MRAAVAVAAALAMLPSAALADSIYLTSGRVIHTEEVRVEGARVIFRQYGGEVSIPLSAVLRIVDNDEAERSVAPEGTQTGPAAVAPPRSGAAPAHPSHEVDYWAKLIREADERIARAQAELDRLPYYDTADRSLLRYSGQALYFMAERDKWDAMMRRFKLTRRQLLEGARKAGITPGALRSALGR